MSEKRITITDKYKLNLPREVVWEKLNDPEVLAACIKGCAYVERETPQNFKAVIRASLGEVKKDFKIDLEVDDSAAPRHYSLNSTVGAGLLGKVTGIADVELVAPTDSNTELTYHATISGGGVLAKALPYVEKLAAKRVHAFFDAFVNYLNG